MLYYTDTEPPVHRPPTRLEKILSQVASHAETFQAQVSPGSTANAIQACTRLSCPGIITLQHEQPGPYPCLLGKYRGATASDMSKSTLLEAIPKVRECPRQFDETMGSVG